MARDAQPDKARDRNLLVSVLGRWPSRILAGLSCFFLFAMMAVTFIDVAGRYLFNSPLPVSVELISFTMPALVFCALPLVCFREDNVTIDLLDNFVNRWWRVAQGIFVNLLSAATMLFMAWRLWARHLDHIEYEDVTDELFIPLAPFSLMMAVLSVVAAVALIANVVAYSAGERKHASDAGPGAS